MNAGRILRERAGWRSAVQSDRQFAILGARVALAVQLGVVAGLVAQWFHTSDQQLACDFHQIWIGARALWNGESPYVAVRAVDPFPLFYPASALTLGLPFIGFSRNVACAAFAGFGVAVLAFALSRQPWRLWALASIACIHAVGLSQWSPLATAGYYLAPAAAVWAVKPQLGIPALLAWPSRWRSAVLVGLLLVAVPCILYPQWPAEWLDALRSSIQISPVARPGGFLLLAAALRWRRAEARWLLGLALLPQTSLLYECFPLFVVPGNRREMATLVVLSWVAVIAQAHNPAPRDVAGSAAAHWPIFLVLLWLPALVMVLRRPNEATDGMMTPSHLASAA